MIEFTTILSFMFNPVEGRLLALASQLGKAAECNIFYVVASFFLVLVFSVLLLSSSKRSSALGTDLLQDSAILLLGSPQGMFHLIKRRLFDYVYNSYTHNNNKYKIT